MLDPTRSAAYWAQQFYSLGTKLAMDAPPVCRLQGRLYVSDYMGRTWGLLSVPVQLVRGIFDAIHEPGIELPAGDDKRLDAAITVFEPDELARIGGADALLNDRGKPFYYTMGRLVIIPTPENHPGIAKIYALRIHSEELQALRKTHGLSPRPRDGESDFTLVVALCRRGVLSPSPTTKNTMPA